MDILKNPNKIAVILYMIILGIVVILVLVVRFLIYYTKKHAEKKINIVLSKSTKGFFGSIVGKEIYSEKCFYEGYFNGEEKIIEKKGLEK